MVKATDEKICSARHSKHTRRGIGTLSSALEVKRIICGGVMARHFAFLTLTFDLSTSECSGTIKEP